MLAHGKQRFGRLAYYMRAVTLFARSHFASFDLHSISMEGQRTSITAVSAMAVRVSDLGGLFGPLTRGTSLYDPHLTVNAVMPPSHWSIPAWFAMSWARANRWNPTTRTFAVREFSCGEGKLAPVQVQADGEWLGRTPMTVTSVPDALRVFVP